MVFSSITPDTCVCRTVSDRALRRVWSCLCLYTLVERRSAKSTPRNIYFFTVNTPASSSRTVARNSRRAFSHVDVHVTTNFGLTGENVTLSLILLGERILHGHAHMPRQELNAARGACTRAAGVVD